MRIAPLPAGVDVDDDFDSDDEEELMKMMLMEERAAASGRPAGDYDDGDDDVSGSSSSAVKPSPFAPGNYTSESDSVHLYVLPTPVYRLTA